MSSDDILSDFPDLTEADIRACLSFAATRIAIFAHDPATTILELS